MNANNFKTTTIILVFMFVSMASSAQHSFGAKVNGGISKVASLDDIDDGILHKYAPSGQAGMFYNFELNKFLSIGTELIFNQIEGHSQNEFDLTNIDGNKVGSVSSNLHTHISYLGLPIYVGFSIKKFTLNIGFQTSFVLMASSNDKTEINYYGDNYDSNSKYDKLDIDKYDFGPRGGIVYNFSDKFAIEGMYYFGINDIVDNEFQKNRLKIRQATIGVKYKFISSKR